MANDPRRRVHLNSKLQNRKRKRDEYEASSASSGYSSSANEFEPAPKRRKISKRAKHEKVLTPILKKTSVLLGNAKRNKFIEVGMCDGSAYTMIKSALDTDFDGIRNTRNFRSKNEAFKAALLLLTVKLFDTFAIKHSEFNIICIVRTKCVMVLRSLNQMKRVNMMEMRTRSKHKIR